MSAPAAPTFGVVPAASWVRWRGGLPAPMEDGLWSACQTLGDVLMVVEHDNPQRPDLSARGSLTFLTGLPDSVVAPHAR